MRKVKAFSLKIVCLFFSLLVKSGLTGWTVLCWVPSAWLHRRHPFLHSSLSLYTELLPTFRSTSEWTRTEKSELCYCCLQQGWNIWTCYTAAVADGEAVVKEAGGVTVFSLQWQRHVMYSQVWQFSLWPSFLHSGDSVLPDTPCGWLLWGSQRPWSSSQCCSWRARITHRSFLWDSEQWLLG